MNALSAPWGVHVDSSGAIYVSDRGNHRIVRWNQGIFFQNLSFSLSQALCFVLFPGASTGVLIAGTTATIGSTSTLLNGPTAVAVDTLNYL